MPINGFQHVADDGIQRLSQGCVECSSFVHDTMKPELAAILDDAIKEGVKRSIEAFYSPTWAERTLRDPDRLIAALHGLWQPMDNAPLQGRVLLYRPTSPHAEAQVVMGWYNSNAAAARRPRPYWSHDLQAVTGTKEARRYAPSAWCPVFLPIPTNEPISP